MLHSICFLLPPLVKPEIDRIESNRSLEKNIHKVDLKMFGHFKALRFRMIYILTWSVLFADGYRNTSCGIFLSWVMVFMDIVFLKKIRRWKRRQIVCISLGGLALLRLLNALQGHNYEFSLKPTNFYNQAG